MQQQKYQNQEEILAAQQQLLHQKLLEASNGAPEEQNHASAPILTEAELMQINAPLAPQHKMMNEEQRQRYQSHLQLQLNQISASNAMGVQQFLHQAADNLINVQSRHHDPMKYHRNFVDGDFEFVSF